MKRIITLPLLPLLLVFIGNTYSETKVHTETIELSYFENSTVTEILKLIQENGFRISEQNPPNKIKYSESMILFSNFFSDFYRKKIGSYECDIAVSGLEDNLGTVSITVRNFRQNKTEKRMQEIFNNLVSKLPRALLPSSVKGPDFISTLSKSLKVSAVDGIYVEVINGIEYRFLMLGTEISIVIKKEGN
jgi:hypothetical protein